MLTIRSKSIYLVISLLLVIWLAISQILASTVAVALCMLCFILLVLLASIKEFAFPLLLFFLPWSPVMKVGTIATSIFTVALLVVVVVYLFHNLKNVNFLYIIPAALLLAWTLIVKTVRGYGIDNSYIIFFALLILFPMISKEIGKKYDFFGLTLFFSLGIITAALSAQMLVGVPTISKYITVIHMKDHIRLSGYYGDPNFYSAHITAAFAGTLLLFLNESSKKRRIFMFAIGLVLFYCGFLAVSKSFVLVAISVILLWLLYILFQKQKLSFKFMIIFTLFVTVIFLLSSTVFTNLIDFIIMRFANESANISDFTSNRSDIWRLYFEAFEKEPDILLFGTGFSKDAILEKTSHNTIIQSIFHFGLLGAVLFFVWAGCYIKMAVGSSRPRFGGIFQILILLIGTIGPWMALDMLFFDEFFLILLYVCIGIRFISNSNGYTQEAIEGNVY